MPLYSWQGITLQGESCHGKTFASSYQELEQELLRKSIGITQVRSTLTRTVSHVQRDSFFTHVAALLNAHIPLYQALNAIAQSTDGYLHEIILDMAHCVAQGKAFSVVLELHGLTDAVSRPLLLVGEQTGTVGPMLQQYVSYREQRALVRSKMNQALIGPLVSVLFFIVTLLGMIFFVVPQFQSFYQAFECQLPMTLQLLVAVRLFFCSMQVVKALLGVLVVFGSLYVWAKTSLGRRAYEWALGVLPGIGTLLLMRGKARILRILGMLLTQGVALAQALQAAEGVMSFICYKQSVAALRKAVLQGTSLCEGWKHTMFTDSEIEALLAIGQASGKLGALMLCAAQRLEERSEHLLNRSIAVINPALMLLLALAIGWLIASLYIPLINLASSL